MEVLKFRSAQKIMKNIDAAIDYALDSMPDDSLIKPLIIANRAEVKRMFITEYDEAATTEKFKKEYLAQGIKEGHSKGVFETLCALVKDGVLNVKDAAERAGISEEAFKERMEKR